MTSLLIAAAVLGWNMEFADGSSARVNYDNAAVAPYTLEDPLAFFDGSPVKTAADWQDELMFTWHILLDSKTAKTPDKPSKDKEPVPRYSYYTASVRYVNVPKGSHAASVVLPPSVLARYGEPAAIAVVISNKEGDVLDGQNEGADAVVGKKLADKWWENSDQVMSAKDKAGTPLIARRQGLLDRSKTIFALGNADDYEMVQQ